jgi:hypothetical protein
MCVIIVCSVDLADVGIPPLIWVNVSAAVALTGLQPRRGVPEAQSGADPVGCENVTHEKRVTVKM